MDVRHFAAILLLFTAACKKTNGSGSSEQTLQQYFSGSGQYTLFDRALQRTHLDTLLDGTNSYTVFAPGDSAMSQAGYTAAGIDSADIGALTQTLLYHLVPGAIASTDVELYQETILTTADSNYQAYLEYNNFGLFYNGIPLVSVDNRLSNGIVQGIRLMARPPLGDVITTLSETPGLSDFSYVVTNAENTNHYGGYYNGVVPYISGTVAAPLTLFLPDNNFFASQGLDNYTAILQRGSPPAFLAAGQLFTSDFIGENVVNAGGGAQVAGSIPLWFSEDGYSFVEYQSYGSSPLSPRYRIVQANIVATNGIIHVIEPY